MRPIALLTGAAVLAACAPRSGPPDEPVLLLFGGYRDPADSCRIAGETPFTSPFLDHTRDLVACPEGAENLGVFVTETGATEVARTGGYILFSNPYEHA